MNIYNVLCIIINSFSIAPNLRILYVCHLRRIIVYLHDLSVVPSVCGARLNFLKVKKFSILLLFLALLLATPLKAGEARFSLLTCSPGEEAYSLFGHTALRYCDDERKVDLVYNYGYFSFDSPNFVWRFILGQTDYLVASVPYRFFIQEYAERGSSVVEQVLELTPAQVARLRQALDTNCLPANRVYRYNYFYRNCTTMARDMFIGVLGEGRSIVYDNGLQPMTLRQALASFTAVHPWYSFGIDLLMGSDIDKAATREELQFAPLNLMDDMAKANIVDGNGNVIPAVRDTYVLLEENKPASVRNNLTPFNSSLLLLLFTFVIMLCELRSNRTFWGFDLLLMALQGLSGVLLLFLGLCSEHPAVDANYVILLLNPLALVLLPIVLYRMIRNRSLTLMWVQVAFVALFFLSGIIGLQHYPAPLYFCAVAILVRSLFHIYKKRICELNIV